MIYVSSFFQECYLVNGKSSIGSFGLIAFLLGWLNFDVIGIIWLANPLFIASVILFMTTNNKRLPLILSMVSLFLALSFMKINEIIKNEGGGTGYITEYLNGYWIWLTSITLMTIILLNKQFTKN